ncbi:VWA domain-containing protein [Candidatus Zixiibacteriota bacterium]
MIFRFASPIILALLITVPVILYIYFVRRRGHLTPIRFSDTRLVSAIKSTARVKQRHLVILLRALVLALIIVAAARPQAGTVMYEVTAEGIDIMLVLDISSSMKAEDFRPDNRLGVAKGVIKDFVAGRSNDRIGLVVFAKQAFTQCPLTLDYGVLVNFLEEVDFGLLEDGTAIGLAVATGLNRLRDSKAESKVMVLLTDGVNNAGFPDPIPAAEMGKTLDVKMYTVGVGKPGKAPYPVDDPIFGKRYRYLPDQIDEEMLRQMAELTGGLYFRAQTPEMLADIYDQISALEKTEIKSEQYTRYRELFSYFALAGLGLFLFELLLAHTRFRRIP